MKDKPKNSESSHAKTFVIILLSFVVVVLGAIAIIAVLASILLFVLFVIWVPIKNQQFIQNNTPLVQEAVIEQCSIPDYLSDGNFDTSSLGFYYDFYEPSQLRIDCQLDDYRRDEWHCTCEDRASD